MVRPARFAFNPQTAPSNAFQQEPGNGPARRCGAICNDAALREFDALAEALQRAGVRVIVAEDTEVPGKPDALFPNNWVSFHRDGTVVLYPMLAPNRRSRAARGSRTASHSRRSLPHHPHRGFELPRKPGPISRGHRQLGARSGAARGLRESVAAHRSRCVAANLPSSSTMSW